mmetsp:Transcript_10355/g.24853  ORF Transcript_10355/g.24853 Transcript_10355/m.24853 type:complete len:344 (+) Transcript_10355:67-1098(+)
MTMSAAAVSKMILLLMCAALHRSAAQVAYENPPRFRGGEEAQSLSRRDVALLAGTSGAIIGSLVAARSFVVVPPSRVGVISLLGRVRPSPLEPGLHIINPLSAVTTLSTKTQLFEMANHVPTREGVIVRLDVALLFHIDPVQAPRILTSLGQGYTRTIIAPELASAVRGLTAESDASNLYTVGRLEVQTRLKQELSEVLAPRGIVVESVLLKDVDLPEMLTDAIERKAQAEQAAERMQYVIQRERQEAHRKEIEAEGIAKFQKIVSKDISDKTLMWKGIEVTHEIATSNNAKIVVVGNSGESLPILLGEGWGRAAVGEARSGGTSTGSAATNGEQAEPGSGRP